MTYLCLHNGAHIGHLGMHLFSLHISFVTPPLKYKECSEVHEWYLLYRDYNHRYKCDVQFQRRLGWRGSCQTFKKIEFPAILEFLAFLVIVCLALVPPPKILEKFWFPPFFPPPQT